MRRRSCAMHGWKGPAKRNSRRSTQSAVSGRFPWRDCPNAWQAPFRPPPEGDYVSWPLLTDLMPWQHSGVQLKRTWPIAPDEDTLERRWRALLSTPDRAVAFRETDDRLVEGRYSVEPAGAGDSTSIRRAARGRPCPPNTTLRLSVVRPSVHHGRRPADVAASPPAVARPRPETGLSHEPAVARARRRTGGDGLRGGPRSPPFPGRKRQERRPALPVGGRLGSEPPARPARYSGRRIPGGRSPRKDVFAYGLWRARTSRLHGAFRRRARSPRVALAAHQGCAVVRERPRDWREAAPAALLRRALHARRRTTGRGSDAARRVALAAVPGDVDGYPETFRYDASAHTLYVGEGAFAPVSPEVHGFEVSGLKVVASWLGHRMKRSTRRKSSPLDDIRRERWPSAFTTELLELLWVLEKTSRCNPNRRACWTPSSKAAGFAAVDLPVPPAEMRSPPRPRTERDLLQAQRA